MTFSIIGTDIFNNTITIEQQQRRQGLYIIGSTGRGKTVLLENLIMQEITQGIGLCVLDPHRDLTRRIIELMPVNRLQDVLLLDIANNDYAFGLNLYSSPTQSVKDVQYAIERIMHIWERLFNISRLTPQMVQYMRKCAETLIPNPGYTMAEIPRLFDDIPFRNMLLANVTDPNVLRFWQRHDAKPKIDKSRETDAILNKLDEFLTGMVIPIVGQSKSTLDFRTLMDTRPGKIILVQLDPNLDSITSLIGSMIVALVRNAAFSRENILQNKRKHFSVYCDEFDRFSTLDMKSIMDECRKYGIALTYAQQTRDILHREVPGLVRSTLQGNLVVFQITSPDAEELAGNFDTTPNMEESGRRKKQTPVTDIIGWLLSGKGSHASSIVTSFVHRHHNLLKNLTTPAINSLFYDAMIHAPLIPSTDVIVPILTLLNEKLLQAGKPDAAYFSSLHEDYTSQALGIQHMYDKDITRLILMLLCVPDGSVQQATILQQLKSFTRVELRIVKLANLRQWILQVANLRMTYVQCEPWFYIDPQQVSKREMVITKFSSSGKYFVTEYKVDPGQEGKFYTEAALMQYIDQTLTEETPVLLNVITEFKQVMQALATNPILGDSGEEETIYKPGSHADKQKEITNLLSGLSVLHAYTRVGGTIQACTNCGATTRISTLFCGTCGKKLKPEYHLTITPSSHGLPKRDVDARIDAITQANVRDGYLRKRSDVLAEIQARQQPPPPPAAPQPAIPPKPPPAPAPAQQAVQPPVPPKPFQAPPPLPQARRKVPKPKVCPDCSQPNDPAANFCMKCGKKL